MLEPIKPPQARVLPQNTQLPSYQAAPATQTWNLSAIVSIVAAVLTFIIFIVFPVAIIAGHIGLSQIKKTGQKGKALAIIGLIVGWLYFVGLLFIVPALMNGVGI